jgi:hypothetical protein
MVATSSEMVEVEMDSGDQHWSGQSAARAVRTADRVHDGRGSWEDGRRGNSSSQKWKRDLPLNSKSSLDSALILALII